MINFYCDESTHLKNDKQPYMILGFVSVPLNKLKTYKEKINYIKEKHKFFSEIKWVKASNSKKEFYLDLINFFFESDMCFSALVIDKKNHDHLDFNAFEDLYYEMYLKLLNSNISSEFKYNVYLDIKDTLSSWKIQRLKAILHDKHGSINNFQNIRSHESLYLQITDVLIGAINYDLRNKNAVDAKNEIIINLKNNLKCDDFTLLETKKFNIKSIVNNAF